MCRVVRSLVSCLRYYDATMTLYTYYILLHISTCVLRTHVVNTHRQRLYRSLRPSNNASAVETLIMIKLSIDIAQT